MSQIFTDVGVYLYITDRAQLRGLITQNSVHVSVISGWRSLCLNQWNQVSNNCKICVHL